MEDSLQFDRAELSSPAACGACKNALRDSYFQVSGQTLCSTCADQARALVEGTGSPGGRWLRAALFGIGAGILGAAIYYAVLALTGYNVGLVAIVVGVLVGRAVRKGSGGIGGLGYQFMAAGITYLAIASTFLPMALSELKSEAAKDKKPLAASTTTTGESTNDSAATRQPNAETPVTAAPAQEAASINPIFALLVLLLLTLSLPILLAFGGGVLTLVIVGFGVWEAWRVNKRLVLHITGPHPLAAEVPPLPTATVGA